jgi:peptide-methionine (S)-S-oxide reductase
MFMAELATLGGGCYWCLEAFYQHVRGIDKVESGYSGGDVADPSAERVYSGDTGHAEVVQLTFNPKIISYKEILEIFFVMHDPTTLNRQGSDVGPWYRSVILYHDTGQQKIAEELKNNYATQLWKDPVVTEIALFEKFWPAEEYMQDFYNKNPQAGYCQVIIDPKIQKLRQQFAAKLK